MASDSWRPVQEAPQNEGPIWVMSVAKYRFRQYSPEAQREMGVKGRWQVQTEHGWRNADLPRGGEFVVVSPKK